MCLSTHRHCPSCEKRCCPRFAPHITSIRRWWVADVLRVLPALFCFDRHRNRPQHLSQTGFSQFHPASKASTLLKPPLGSSLHLRASHAILTSALSPVHAVHSAQAEPLFATRPSPPGTPAGQRHAWLALQLVWLPSDLFFSRSTSWSPSGAERVLPLLAAGVTRTTSALCLR